MHAALGRRTAPAYPACNIEKQADIVKTRLWDNSSGVNPVYHRPVPIQSTYVSLISKTG